MAEFKPTVVERLIIGMLCDIYKHLELKGGYDASLLEEAVVGPHHWALAWKYSFQDPVDEEVADEVSLILNMWEMLEVGYERLSEEDQTDLEAPKFPGFDLNEETNHYSVADVMINRLDRFQRFKERDLNSHYPMLHEHRDMLPRYQAIKKDFLKTREGWPPNKQQIEQILKG